MGWPSSRSHRRLRGSTGVVGCAAVCATVLATCPAKAESFIGVQADVNTLAAPSRSGAGLGADVLLGKRLDLKLLMFSTELSLGMHALPGADDPTAYRAMVGGSVGLGFALRPSLFGHIGVGHIGVAPNSVPDQSRTSLATELGLALDFTLLPLIDLGVQVSHNAIGKTSDTDPFRWWQGGVHATLVL